MKLIVVTRRYVKEFSSTIEYFTASSTKNVSDLTKEKKVHVHPTHWVGDALKRET